MREAAASTSGNNSARLLHCWKGDSVVFGRTSGTTTTVRHNNRPSETTTTATGGSSSSSLYNGMTRRKGDSSGFVRGVRGALSAMDALLADFILRERNLFTIRPDRSVYENFEVIGSLGKGTFASVHKVRDKSTGEILAAKMLDLSRFGSSTRGRVAEMFANEIKYAFACSCPGVVQVRSVVRGREGYLMLQELIVGGTLWDHFQCRSDQERFLLVLQLTQSLLQMQDARVIHRDLKPTNILRREERVWVSDFGWSETYKRANSRPHELPGTIEINPSEVHAHSDQQTEKVDNYALGLNLMLIMSGHFVCRDKTKVPDQAAQRILSTIRKIRESAPLVGFNADSWHLFLRLTESNPDKRITLPEALRLPWFTNNLLRFADYISSMGAKHQINFIWHPLVQSVSMELVACSRPSLLLKHNNNRGATTVRDIIRTPTTVRSSSTVRESISRGEPSKGNNSIRRAINGTSAYFPTTQPGGGITVGGAATTTTLVQRGATTANITNATNSTTTNNNNQTPTPTTTIRNIPSGTPPPQIAFESKTFRNALSNDHETPRTTYRRQTESRTRNKTTGSSTGRIRATTDRSLIHHLITDRTTPRVVEQGRLRGDQSLASPSSGESLLVLTPQRISPLLWKSRRVNF